MKHLLFLPLFITAAGCTHKEPDVRHVYPPHTSSEHVYRVDKFIVPDAARAEFLNRAENIQSLLKTLSGFVQGCILEQSSGPGTFNFVTVVEWDSQASMVNAKAKVTESYVHANFDPQEMLSRLGIKADLGNYRKIYP